MPKHAETSEIVGKFGEYLVALNLVQRDVHVFYADTAGFDLLAVDPHKRYFPTDQVVGISVNSGTTRFICA